MTHRFRVTLASLALFTLQGACASLSTLESARVNEKSTLAIETVVLDKSYAERQTQEVDPEAEQPRYTNSEPRIEPLSIAIVGRSPGEDGQKRSQVEYSISSAGNVMVGFKYQFLDFGPLAASAGLKLGTDIISFLDFLTDEDDESDHDENDIWKKRIQVVLPLIVSVHPMEGFDVYLSGRAQWLGAEAGYHKLLVGTAGTCIGTRFGVCAEAGRYYSGNTDFDGYFGAFSFRMETGSEE